MKNYFVILFNYADGVVGILNVSGNVQRDGDITLNVQDQDIVMIEPYSKTLILKKKLDKEGPEGKDGIKLEVICIRKKSEDPSITIPIHIIIMDANDNTPEFVNAPYCVQISEATLVGSTIIHTILAIDKDQKGPFSTVEYSIERGPFSLSVNSPTAQRQRKLIPLMYKPCPMPTLLKYVSKVDFTKPDVYDWIWKKLLISIKGTLNDNVALPSPTFCHPLYLASQTCYPNFTHQSLPMLTLPNRSRSRSISPQPSTMTSSSLAASTSSLSVSSATNTVSKSVSPVHRRRWLTKFSEIFSSSSSHSNSGNTSSGFHSQSDSHLVSNDIVEQMDEGYSPRSALTTLTVTVLDADDQNPQFSAERYKARLPENPQPGSKLLMLPTSISAVDPDEGIRASIEYSFLANNGETAYFNINTRTGEITLKNRLPVNFKLPVTLVVRATQIDNEDRQSLTTVQISDGKTILNEFRFLHTIYDAKVLEHTPRGIVVVTLQTIKSLETDAKFRIVEKQENFLISNFGEVMIAKPPDYEAKKHFLFHVTVSDGQQHDITTVNITVLDINDHNPTFLQPSYFFEVNNPMIRTGTVLGKVEAIDEDTENTIRYSLYGFHASAFSITNMGELQIVDVDAINTTVCYLMAIATDDGKPARHSTVPVTIKFPEAFIFQNLIKKDDSYILTIAFGVLLGILFIVIIILIIYIMKYKNDRENSIQITNEEINKFTVKPIEEVSSSDKLISNNSETDRVQDRSGTPTSVPMNSLEVYTNGKRRELHHTSPYKVTMNGFMRNSESAMSNYPSIQWPNGSIPQRVKTIGWEADSSTKIGDAEADKEQEAETRTTLKLEIFEQTSTDES
ncbi:cadherin-related family member 1-like [Centruroides sculpturatus]|uniref:cadherin-related family member 1-like n=1 Tax=Centruroides sculpturatus TaxID=218467 RepID=UPI000C6DC79B|nr:cadherin-related family member 1-like [Centruroides sculpturatus]